MRGFLDSQVLLSPLPAQKGRQVQPWQLDLVHEVVDVADEQEEKKITAIGDMVKTKTIGNMVKTLGNMVGGEHEQKKKRTVIGNKVLQAEAEAAPAPAAKAAQEVNSLRRSACRKCLRTQASLAGARRSA
mmetsp:Transcript_30295/g.61714  ORF Transcript_30295/g.61714 Transcript_30295/m.61714 type:complete len:130 (+) Transcript_30295:95-484(+)